MGPPSAGSTTETELKTTGQQDMINKMLQIYGSQVGNYQSYQGERVAPFSDLQRSVLGSMESFGSTGPPLSGETGQAIKGVLSGQTGAKKLEGGDIDSYFKTAFQDPAIYNLRENINPSIDEAFAGPGFFGSARSNARVDAAQDTSRWLGEQRGGLEWDVLNRNQGLDEARADRTLSAFGPAMQYSMQPIDVAKELFGFGAAEQTQKQRELEGAFQKFIDDNRITDPETLNVLMTLIGQNITSTSDTAEKPWGSEQWGQFGAKVGAGALLGGLFL